MAETALGRETRVRPAPSILSKVIEGEAVLLDPEAGTYFGLNGVGTRVWTLLGEDRPMGEVHRRLLAELEVDGDRLWGDLVAIVGDLVANGLVEVDPS